MELMCPSPGGDMKKCFILLVLTCSVLLAPAFAGNVQRNYQSGTVVSVETHETPSNAYAGSNLSDAPMQSEVFSYDIGILVGCTVYRTQYDSAIDYLPAVFAPHHPIQVNLRRHVLNVNVPSFREVRLPIYGRSAVKDQSCTARN
jgi:hypothetical protein